MGNVSRRRPTPGSVPELHAGDRMSRAEFHRIYSLIPEDFKAELIGGVVHVPSPLRRTHGTRHSLLDTIMGVYVGGTPGIELANNATILLGDGGEPQPDLVLRILPEFGGQSQTTGDEYIQGPPELVAEIAHSSAAIDLYSKREDYARYGVIEYIVFCLQEQEVRWIDLRDGREFHPDANGIIKVRSFPGLWIDSRAVLANDYARAISAVQAGLTTPEHAAFVERLSAKRASPSS